MQDIDENLRVKPFEVANDLYPPADGIQAAAIFQDHLYAVIILQNPNQYRKVQANEMLKLAARIIELNDEIESQAASFVTAGVKPLDALHVVSAIWAKAQYFCTCDDKLLKKLHDLKNLAIEAVSPLQIVAEVAP